MTSKFDSFDQSPLGGFVQSPLGARGIVGVPLRRVLDWRIVFGSSGVWLPPDLSFADPAFHVGLSETIFYDTRSSWTGDLDDYALVLVHFDQQSDPEWWPQVAAGWTGRTVLRFGSAIGGFVGAFGYRENWDWINSVSGATGLSLNRNRWCGSGRKAIMPHALTNGLSVPSDFTTIQSLPVVGGAGLEQAVDTFVYPLVDDRIPSDVTDDDLTHENVVIAAEHSNGGVSWIVAQVAALVMSNAAQSRAFNYRLFSLPSA